MINIPTTAQIYNSVIADFQTQYGNTISPFGQVFLRAAAGVWAGKLRLKYALLGFLQKNLFVDTADPEAKGGTLERFGRVKLGRNPFQAQPGLYKLKVTGTTGATIAASTTFLSDDSSLSPGYLFILDNAYTLTSPIDSIVVRALVPGMESKLNIGDSLTVTSPIALVDSSAVVLLINTPPLAAEDIEDYRRKVEDSYRFEAQGGAGTDYRLWSFDAQGVLRVYPYAKSGFTNEMNLFIEATIVDSIDGKGTPTATIINDVETVVNQSPNVSLPTNERGRKPVTVIVNYLPVTIINVDIVIASYAGITVPIQTLLLAAIKAMTDKIRPYVDSTDLVSDKNDILDNNKVINAILNQTPGATFGAITININGVPMASYTFVQGNIPYLNSVTYV